MTRQRKADLLLVLVTGLWGGSYYLSDLVLAEMPPFALCAFRFLLAFALLGIALLPRLRGRTSRRWQYYIWLAAVLRLLVRPDRRMLLSLVLCAVGLALLTLGDDFRPAVGDLICLLCALGYAINLLVVEHAVGQPEVDALQLGVFQQLITGITMLLLSLLFETPCLPQTATGWGSALFLSIFCTGIAFAITAVQQKHTSAVHVGLIFTLEPLFSAIVAFFLAGERLTARGYAGAGLMMLALVTMEAGGSLFKKKNQS